MFSQKAVASSEVPAPLTHGKGLADVQNLDITTNNQLRRWDLTARMHKKAWSVNI